MKKHKKRRSALMILSIFVFLTGCKTTTQPIVRVGILHSLSGTMAVSESPVVDATLMALDEINATGGILGRTIEPIIVDTRSDAQYAAEQAERLIVEEGVEVIFGCWTSACRRTVSPVIEKHNKLLFYPVQYEGLDSSPNTVYTGATPNQQLTIAAQWAYRNIGDRFFLVGSDYIYPHAANEIVKDKIQEIGGQIAGEQYILLGSTDVDEVINQIVETQPDVILNTINGDTNFAFMQGLRDNGITPSDIPTISFSISEQEIQAWDSLDFSGDYAVWSYFQSINTPLNTAFINNYQARYGIDRPTSDPIEAAYNSVYLWQRSVKSAQSFAAEDIKNSIGGISFSSPQGILRVDEENLHLWKQVRIGQIDENGQFEIVWETSSRVKPITYPQSRSEASWDAFVLNLYNSWEQQWENNQ